MPLVLLGVTLDKSLIFNKQNKKVEQVSQSRYKTYHMKALHHRHCSDDQTASASISSRIDYANYIILGALSYGES